MKEKFQQVFGKISAASGTKVLKRIDFGLAIPYRPEFCKPGNRTGTPNYLAPELIKRTTTDHRVDLFALGVTAYECFTNQLPWERSQSLQTLMSHMNSPGRNPRQFRPDLDDAVVALLMKAIERDPKERYQTAAGYGNPDRSKIEGAIKQNPNLPGKLLTRDTADSDGDGIPNYADGYNRDQTTGNRGALTATAARARAPTSGGLPPTVTHVAASGPKGSSRAMVAPLAGTGPVLRDSVVSGGSADGVDERGGIHPPCRDPGHG